MRALICRQWGGIEQLQIGEAPVPRPGRGEVLIRVKALETARPREYAHSHARRASRRMGTSLDAAHPSRRALRALLRVRLGVS